MSKLSRRHLLMRGAAVALAAGITAAGIQVAGAETTTPASSGTSSAAEFDEMYKGRHIRATAAHPGHPQVFIDDVPLHVMAGRDGKFTTIMNHYQRFDSVREATRAAVDQLRGAQLVHVH